MPDGQFSQSSHAQTARRASLSHAHRLQRRANQVHISCRLGLATEGRFAIVTNAGSRCGGRVGLQRESLHADEQTDATAKSCGPGIPTLMPSLWSICGRRWLTSPDTGEITYNPFKPLRREGWLWADPVVPARRITPAADIASAVEDGLASGAPNLIELPVSNQP
jgi:hypothetical protein